jgi:hypothetical protein
VNNPIQNEEKMLDKIISILEEMKNPPVKVETVQEGSVLDKAKGAQKRASLSYDKGRESKKSLSVAKQRVGGVKRSIQHNEEENIVGQLRKAIAEGVSITFADGSTHEIISENAHKALEMFAGHKTALEKGVFATRLSKSFDSFQSAIGVKADASEKRAKITL